MGVVGRGRRLATMGPGGRVNNVKGGEAKRNAAERSGAPSLVAAQRRAASYFVVPRLIAFQNGSVQNRLDDPPFVLVQTLEAHRSSSGADCERASSLPGVNPDKLNRTLSLSLSRLSR